MKEFDPVEIDGKLKPAIAILNFDNKRMPFIDKDKRMNVLNIATDIDEKGRVIGKVIDKTMAVIDKLSKASHIKVVVIDTITHFMSAVVFDELATTKKSNTMQAWSEIGTMAYRTLKDAIQGKLNDKIVIVLSHEESPSDSDPDRRMRIPMRGKMINQAGGIEAFFEFVLWTKVDGRQKPSSGKRYMFQTLANESNHTKVFEGLFDEETEEFIPNDITLVLKRFAERYIGGDNPFDDLSEFPAILVAGASGSGKSRCLKNL